MFLSLAVLITRIPKSTFYELVLEGRIPSQKVGGQLLFPAIGPNGFDFLVISCTIIVSITNKLPRFCLQREFQKRSEHAT